MGPGRGGRWWVSPQHPLCSFPQGPQGFQGDQGMAGEKGEEVSCSHLLWARFAASPSPAHTLNANQ